MKTSPYSDNHEGKPRKMGVELEFSGLPIEQISDTIISLYGGKAKYQNNYKCSISGTKYDEFGPFKVELDATLLKDEKLAGYLKRIGINPGKLANSIEETVADSARHVVPMEIVTPPIPIKQLPELEEMRIALQKQAVKDTRSSVFNAFGLHLNPEVPSLEPDSIRDFLRSFIIMYDWLKDKLRIDPSRRVTPYIDPFPREYARLILKSDYEPDIETLIDDYLAYNPTRNRPLDMLPLFTFIDKDRVMNKIDDGLTTSRPTFHYRLPNCNIADKNWRITDEWNYWVVVERVASGKDRLADLSEKFLGSRSEQFIRQVSTRIKDILK